MGNISYLYPSSWIVPIALIGLAGLVFGFRQFGKGCLMLSLVILLVRPVRGILLALFPAWIAWVVGIIALIAAIYAALRVIFGDEVMKATTAHLLAGAIAFIAGLLLNVVKPLALGLLPGGRLAGWIGATSSSAFRSALTNSSAVDASELPGVITGSVSEQGDSNTQMKITDDLDDGFLKAELDRSGGSKPADIVRVGKIVERDAGVYVVALLDGSVGELPRDTVSGRLQMGQMVSCREVDTSVGGRSILALADDN